MFPLAALRSRWVRTVKRQHPTIQLHCEIQVLLPSHLIQSSSHIKPLLLQKQEMYISKIYLHIYFFRHLQTMRYQEYLLSFLQIKKAANIIEKLLQNSAIQCEI